MSKRALKSLVGFLLALGGYDLRAYPSFIAYGYTSCLSCHFNPYGNGPLNDYGRALSATTISGRPPFVGKSVSDEKLGEVSGFLGNADLGEHIRPAFGYRRLLLVSDLDKQRQFNSYQMQADASLVLKFSEDKYYASGSFGYAPTPPGKPNASHLISREHYFGARIGENWGLYAGFADTVFGIRIPDHPAYSRSRTGLAQNDQVHGIFTHYTGEKLEGGVHLFAGNLYDDEDVRQRGVSGTVEYEVWRNGRLGTSLLYSSNDFRSRFLSSVHLRTRMTEGQSLLTELGLIRERSTLPSASTGTYLFLQSLHRLVRGLHLLGNLEFYTAQAFEPHARYLRFGPSLQWFVFQRLELRADLLNTKKFDSQKGDTNILNFAGQVHLSF